jgi:hypothetical protein
MATTRRGFLRGLLASAAVAPALPAIAEAATALPQPSLEFERYTSYFKWDVSLGPHDWQYVTRIAILDELPEDLPIGTQVRAKLPPPDWWKIPDAA